ncbi:MAG: hypothetical protein ACD_39C00682G0002 [uncultured bacterium]|nr:MAG: hypothetical protein ACD_39C00682G0002 [uncultured bacterium]
MRLAMMLLTSLIFAVSVIASPMPPQPELDIEGLVAVVEWVPEATEKGVWGMSGSLGSDRTFPAHYKVELVDCNVALAEGEIDPDQDALPVAKLGKQEKYSVTLNHPANDGLIKRGMRVKVLGYNVSGDEGGIWTTYKKIETEPAPTCPCEQSSEESDCSTMSTASPSIAVPVTPDVSVSEPRKAGSSTDL